MAASNLEELVAKIQKVQDILEIQQLQHRYVQWMALWSRGDKIIELFAKKAPGVSMESGAPGVFEGYEEIKEFFKRHNPPELQVGMFGEFYVICPVIEVAKDGKTAKGTWFSPGLMGNGPQKSQVWHWGKYAGDYIKEDREWKIWHLKFYPTFITPFEKGWVLENGFLQHRERPEGMPSPIGGNKPATHRKPYNPETTNYLLPEPPEPYKTWGDSESPSFP